MKKEDYENLEEIYKKARKLSKAIASMENFLSNENKEIFSLSTDVIEHYSRSSDSSCRYSFDVDSRFSRELIELIKITKDRYQREFELIEISEKGGAE